MVLTKEQKQQVMRQIEGNQHEEIRIDLSLSEGHQVRDLIVHQNVLNPRGVAATYLAQWLFFNNGLYHNKSAIDVGCGSGIQGIVMANYGAEKVWCTDISDDAVRNTKENICQYGLEDKVKIVQGDLFENISGKADLIVANIPFFAVDPYPEYPISVAMLDSGTLIHRFLEGSKKHLKENGRVVMVYYDMGGDINNPSVQAPKHNYHVELKFRVDSQQDIQKGDISIYEMVLE